MKRRPSKRAAAVMAKTIAATLESQAWREAGDDDRRAWLMLLNLCDVLHPLGTFTVPPRWRVVELVQRLERDAEIRAAFNGKNYDELATRYRMTPRHIRDIVGTRGWRPRKVT